MANYYLHHGAYPAYSATPTWGVAQDGDGTALGLSTPAIGSLVITGLAIATNTITIAGAVLTAVASGAGANQFNVGASLDAQANNIASAINSATNTTNAGTNATNTQLRNWVYARGPSTGAPAATVEIMTRVGSVQFNYATNTNVFITSGGWGSAPTITQFTGGLGGVYGYFINTSTIWPSGITGANYGAIMYTMGPSSIQPGAGDTIYVRTKASGVDITCQNTTFQNLAINLKQFSTDPVNPTKVIFDGGTIWSGDDGVFKLSKNYSSGSMRFNTTTQNFLAFIGKDRTDLGAGKKNFKVVDESNVGSGYYIMWAISNGCYYKNIEFSDEHVGTYVSSGTMYVQGNGINATMNIPNRFSNCTFRTNNSSSNGYSWIRQSWAYPTGHYFKECDFYYTNQTIANGGLISDNTVNSATATSLVFDRCTFHGLFNGANRLLSTSGTGQNGKLSATYLIKNCEGIDAISGTFGYWAHGSSATGSSTSLDLWLRFISVNNKNITYFEHGLGYYVLHNASGGYPTLFAKTMSGDAFSCLISPSSRTTDCISYYNPFYTTEFSKLNTLTDGARTLTIEMLIDQNYGSSLNTETLAVEVSYINASGVQKFYSTRADVGLGAALTSSSSAWSATTYVLNSLTHNYDKKKFVIVTPESVKQNTIISFKLGFYTYSPSANDVLFLDPDFEVV